MVNTIIILFNAFFVALLLCKLNDFWKLSSLPKAGWNKFYIIIDTFLCIMITKWLQNSQYFFCGSIITHQNINKPNSVVYKQNLLFLFNNKLSFTRFY